MMSLLFDCAPHERGISIVYWSFSTKDLEISEDSNMEIWKSNKFLVLEDKKPRIDELPLIEDAMAERKLIYLDQLFFY